MVVSQLPAFMHTETPQGTAIVHCRVSLERQRFITTSLPTQATLGRELAAQYGLDVLHVTEEVGSGASLWSRPLLMRDRAALLAGRAQVLIVTDADRLSRDFVHLALILESCARVGASVLAVNESLPSAEDMLLLRNSAHDFARVERERIRDRIVQGKSGRALAGKAHRAGVDKYGYRRTTQGDARVIYEPEAAIVRQIFTWFTLDSLSYTEIARRLSEHGVLPPSAGKIRYREPERTPRWGVSQIRRMLTDPAYKGQAIAWRWKSHGPHHNPEERPAEEQIPLPEGVIPAIVSGEMWDIAQVRSAAIHQIYQEMQQRAQRYLLTGHIWCAVCGRRMDADPHGGDPVYRCCSRDSASGTCGASQIQASAVGAWVWEQVQRLLSQPARLGAVLEHQRAILHNPLLVTDHEIVRDFAMLISTRRERVQEYLRKVGSDAVSAELAQRELAQLAHIAEQVAVTQNELDELLAATQQPAIQLERLLATLPSTEPDPVYPLDEQRFALDALGVRVIANGWQWQLHCDVLGEASLVTET